MSGWLSLLDYNPINAFQALPNEEVKFFVARDLLGKQGKDSENIRTLPAALNICRKQEHNGSWKYPGVNNKLRTRENYDQIETYRQLGFLVEMYAYDRSSEVIRKAADFLFRFQTKEGDIRGIYGNQYTPNYTAGMLELLIKAGYTDDPHVEKAFAWLKSIRQEDGGWAIPLRTRRKKLDTIIRDAAILEPDKSQPFSHLVTGVVLRAYAAHDCYRESKEALEAGYLLRKQLFKKDNYPDRGTADFWLRFTFPFWFTDLISALDSLSLLGFKPGDPQIDKALVWLISQQQKNGLWDLYILKNQKYNPTLWLSLCICRILKRFYPE